MMNIFTKKVSFLALVMFGLVSINTTSYSQEESNNRWNKVDLFDHVGIIRVLAIKGIKGCGSVPKVYQYKDEKIFNVYCDPANKWYGVNTSTSDVFNGADDFPYK